MLNYHCKLNISEIFLYIEKVQSTSILKFKLCNLWIIHILYNIFYIPAIHSVQNLHLIVNCTFINNYLIFITICVYFILNFFCYFTSAFFIPSFNKLIKVINRLFTCYNLKICLIFKILKLPP